MKRVITAFCLAVLGTFALTACAQRSDPPTNRESTPPAQAQDAIDAAQDEEDEEDVQQGGGPHVD